MTVQSIAISGTNAGDFTAGAGTCTAGGAVGSGGSCTIPVTFTPSAMGSRSATLTVKVIYNAGQWHKTMNMSLTGTGVPPPTAGFSGTPASGLLPLVVSFTDQSDNYLGTQWNWSFGDGAWENGTVTSNPVHTYTGAGTYTAALTVTNASGSNTLTRAGYITVSTVPVVTTTTGTGGFAIGSGGSDSDGSTGAGEADTSTANQTQGPRKAPLQDESTRVNVGGSTPVTSATVYGTGNRDAVVTAKLLDGPPAGSSPAPGSRVYSYLEITPARTGMVTGAEISFTVSQSWLDEHHLSPEQVVMYHAVGGQWVALPTTVVRSANGQVYFSATTPSFSLFTIGVKQGSVPALIKAAPATFSGFAAGSNPLQGINPAPAYAAATPQPTETIAPAATRPGFPLATLALIGAGCVVLAGSGWYVRRWWIRRQNPALYEDF